MTLKELFSIFPAPSSDLVSGPPLGDFLGRQVSALCIDSRKLQADCVFFAVRGEKVDGHLFLPQAAASGAIALVVEDRAQVPVGYAGLVLKTDSVREVLNRLAARYFGEPAKSMICVGVTGTNGKTTTTYLIEALLNHAGHRTGVIGTINHHLGNKIWPTEMTTPDPVEFQKRLKEFKDLGATAVTLEVSSHALRQSRVDEVPFDVAVFTNLSRDHLDYHRDMDDYFDAKRRLFADLLTRSTKGQRFAVINADDEYGQRIRLDTAPGDQSLTVWRYGRAEGADLRFEVLAQGFDGTRFRLNTPFGEEEFHVPMPGLHNVENACAAIGVGLSQKLSLAQCREALAGFAGVKGRLEAVPNREGVHVFVDYAHTDAAVMTVLRTLQSIRQASGIQNRIITVFGCGGDRDRGKRPMMMKAAVDGSDLVVVTSDNPRSEDPLTIVQDALSGADPAAIGKTVFQEVDRKLGIAKALELAKPGDVVLIAGKGHEDYQQIGTTKFPFSDTQVVKELLQ